MAISQKTEKGSIVDPELGNVEIDTAPEMDKKLAAKKKLSTADEYLAKMKEKEDREYKITSKMLKKKTFKTMEEARNFELAGGQVFIVPSDYPAEVLVVKEEYIR